jgi:hypothetical protein
MNEELRDETDIDYEAIDDRRELEETLRSRSYDYDFLRRLCDLNEEK